MQLSYIGEAFVRWEGNFLLKNASGLSSCSRIALMLDREASVSTTKALEKFGNPKIGAWSNAYLRFSKELVALFDIESYLS